MRGAAKKTLPLLAEAARKDENPNVRTTAVYALINSGQDEAIPILIDVIKDKDGNVRPIAISNLARFGAKAKGAVPNLIEALKDAQPYTRWMSAYALGQIGADAKDAVPALREALKDKDPNVRQYAGMALKRIEGK